MVRVDLLLRFYQLSSCAVRLSLLLQYARRRASVSSPSILKSMPRTYKHYKTAVVSRQFRDMSRARIESLLASFPKLIPTNTQHTSVETTDVRYVYQPLEDLYILLITNKASNILQDIDTLHLFARVVSDMCRSAEEREILKNSFQLLGAFDEIVSQGYREQVNLMQVRSVLEMESHEEKIQEIIARVRLPSSFPTSLQIVLTTYSDDRTKSKKQKKNSNAAPNNSKCNAANNSAEPLLAVWPPPQAASAPSAKCPPLVTPPSNPKIGSTPPTAIAMRSPLRARRAGWGGRRTLRVGG